MCQECFTGVSKFYKGVPGVFKDVSRGQKRGFMSLSRISQGCVMGHGCYKGVSGCIKGVTRIFKGC